MTSNRHRTFSPEQAAYLAAKANHDAILEQVGSILNDLLDACGTLSTNEEIEAYCEQEAAVHHEYGTLQAEKTLREAEQALLDWGLAHIKRSGLAASQEIELRAFHNSKLSQR
jgi:hypothetical protein